MKVLKPFFYNFIYIVVCGCLLSCNALLEPEIGPSEDQSVSLAESWSLDTISDKSISEMDTLAVDASVDGVDIVSGASVLYSCSYDIVIDNDVRHGISCTVLTGLSFNTATGELNWTPNYTQAGSYEFLIRGEVGGEYSEDIFGVVVSDSYIAPSVTIADQAIFASNTLSFDISDDNGTDSADDGEAITYTCHYDTTVDSSVGSGADSCSTLSGFTLDAATGVLSWNTSPGQEGDYEVKITATTAQNLSTDVIFKITVNTNHAPSLNLSATYTVSEMNTISFNTEDSNAVGTDQDQDGETLTYSCLYDDDNDSVYSKNCTDIDGVFFSTTTGVFSWLPSDSQAGKYNIRVSASDGNLSGNTDVVVTVYNTIMPIANQSVIENSEIVIDVNSSDALGDEFDIDGGTSVTYTCTTSRGGASCTDDLTGTFSFDGATGLFKWTPGYGEASHANQYVTTTITITATDNSYTTTSSFDITVKNLDRAPDSIVIDTAPADFYVHFFEDVTLKVTDPDASETYVSGVTADDYSNVNCVILDSTNVFYTSTNITYDGTGKCTIKVMPTSYNNGSGKFKYYAVVNGMSSSTVTSGDYVIHDSMDTIWKTTVDNETITLPIDDDGGAYTYDFDVNWGDGTIEHVNNGDTASHAYSEAGTYHIYLKGTIPSWDFETTSTSATKITEVVSLGDIAWQDLEGAFKGCTNLTSFISNTSTETDTSNVDTMAKMFENATKIDKLNFADVDTSSVTDMSRMFAGLTGITTLDLTDLDTSSVTNMSGMFVGSTSLTAIDLSNFNTANVTNMSSMFEGATGLTDIDISSFNTAKVTDMSSMFKGTTNLATITFPTTFSCGTGTTKGTMASLFQDATGLSELDVGSFNTSNVNNMSSMFAGAIGLGSLNLESLDTSNVINMSSMFDGATGLSTINMNGLDTANVTNFDYMFRGTAALATLTAHDWDIDDGSGTAISPTDPFAGTNTGLKVECNDQDATPDGSGTDATGSLFGQTCN